MSRSLTTLARVCGGAAVLGVVVWQVGPGPFLHGVRTVDAWSLTAAAGIAVLTTVCCAWRWSLVARGLGVEVPLGSAVAAYYRSQFLNTMLPGATMQRTPLNLSLVMMAARCSARSSISRDSVKLFL